MGKQLEVNLRATLNLLPLFELTVERLKNHGHNAATLAETRDDEARRTYAFLNANTALRPGAVLCPDSRLLSSQLSIPFAEIVPLDGSKITQRSEYGMFIINMMMDMGFWNTTDKTEWRDGRPLADRIYAGLVFYLLWQGPTKAEPFWPDWDPETGPPSSVDFYTDQQNRNKVDRRHQSPAREQFRVAKFVHTLYAVNTNKRHPRHPLLERFLNFLLSKCCISPYSYKYRKDMLQASRTLKVRLPAKSVSAGFASDEAFVLVPLQNVQVGDDNDDNDPDDLDDDDDDGGDGSSSKKKKKVSAKAVGRDEPAAGK
jgi:hypothetical protein